MSFDEFDAVRPPGRIVATSGGFDPIHPGHISSIQASADFGDVVVAVVNGDRFLESKKGRAFQDLRTRCLIVSGVRGVDFVVPFEIDGDLTVREALRRLRPHVFTKGGDRVDHTTIPEWDVCDELGIEVVSGVGADKQWSSSWFLERWERTQPVGEAIPVLHVAEAGRAVAWYRRLGYEQEWEHRVEPSLPTFVSMARHGSSRLFLSEHTGDARPDTLVHLRVTDVDEIAAAFDVEVVEAPWGRETHLTDPDGNRLRIGTATT